MSKGQDLFLDHFARLGVFSKVSALAGSFEEFEEEGAMAEDTKEPKQVKNICPFKRLPALWPKRK